MQGSLMFWYHELTKHSYLSIRQNPNLLSWEDQPGVYKQYDRSFERFPLDMQEEEDRFLFHIAGLTAKKSYAGGEYYLRINPSAGALYPNELYMQIRGVQGKKDGIYYFSVAESALVLLYPISKEEGIEPYLGYTRAMKGYLFLVSAIYWRSSWKYKQRAFRYCLLDAGHVLGCIEASALLKPHATQMYYVLERETLNRMFGFGNREWFLSGAAVAVPIKEQSVQAVSFSLPYTEGSGSFEQSNVIEEAYEETRLLQGCHRMVRAPRFAYRTDKLRETIFHRRSQRDFDAEAMTKGQFGYIMETLSQPVLSDCDEDISVYVVINRVLDMPLGLYRDGSYLKYGDFSQKAGYLCLEQYGLAAQGALTFFLTSNGKNYQALYQKAGLIGHRLYIAALYLGLGCSGIGAYYDDEVNTFLENEEMVLYALAVGR